MPPDPTDAPTRELGHGLSQRHIAGVPDNPVEEAPELAWPESVKAFGRMWRTDAATHSVMRAIFLATGRLHFRLDPNGAPDAAVAQIAEDTDIPILGVAPEDLPRRTRSRGRFSFRDHRRLAYLSLVYGHAFFNQVGAIVEGGDPYTPSGWAWRLRKLSWRAPQTIAAINVASDGGLDGIEQWPAGTAAADGGQTSGSVGPSGGIPIPVSALVAYVHEREGGAWAGNSILRAAYKHWLIKDRVLRKFPEVADRNGSGVPILEAPEGATREEIDEFYSPFAQAFRSGPSAGGAIPHGSRLRLLGVEGTLPDLQGMVRYQDEQIAQNALAQFLRLGVTATGSRALGDTFLDFFAASVDAMAWDFAETFTQHVIEDQVDWNFGVDVPAPRLVVQPFEEQQVLSADEIVRLVGAGVLPAGADMRAYLADRYGLPETALQADPEADGDGGARASVRVTSPPKPSTPPARPVLAARPHPRAWRVLAAFEDDAGHDPAERADRLDEALAALLAAWQPIRDSWRDVIVDGVAGSGGLEDISGIVVPRGEGAATIEAAMADMAAFGVEAAVREAQNQSVTLSVSPPGPERFQDRAFGIEGLLAGGLLTSARHRAALAGGDVDRWDPDTVADAVATHLDGLAQRYEQDWLGGALAEADTTGRVAAYTAGPPARYWASEILDKSVCGPCAAIDGTEFATLAAATAAYPAGQYDFCLGGPRCRGTLIAVYV